MSGFARGLLGLAILAGGCCANAALSCANGGSSDSTGSAAADDTDSGGSSSSDDSGTLSNPAPDSGSGGGKDSGGSSTDAGKDSGGGGMCTGAVVVNEIQSDGVSGTDEFVELYNPAACALSLNKYSLNYYSSGGTGAPGAYFVGAAADTIPANGYFVIAGNAFAGASNGKLTGGLAAAAGRVGITDNSGKLLDSVAYGAQSGNNTYVEKSPAPSPASKKSIGRKPNGTDSDDNSADFVALPSPTPGAAN